MRALVILLLILSVTFNLSAWTQVGDIVPLTHKMRCRVVQHSDCVDAIGDKIEYEDNNVNRNFPMLQVIRKYSPDLDILVMFGLNGPNGMFGIRRVVYISNTDPNSISEFPAQLWWWEMYESVGPWHIRAVNNEIKRSAQNFTGGFHAYIDRETGKRYPSGENLGYIFKADGKEINTGDEVLCEEIECISRERLGAYNTYDPDAGGGRMVMENESRYLINRDRIFFRSEYKALEDIVLELHYGMQTVSHNLYMWFMSDEGPICYDTRVDHENEVLVKGTPHGICGEKDNGRCFFARMCETGAFSGTRNNGVKFFARNYGASNFKQYHNVYGNGNIVSLKAGEGDYYEGYFCFSPEVDGALLPNEGVLKVVSNNTEYEDVIDFDICNVKGYCYDNIYCLLNDNSGRRIAMLQSPLTYIPEGTSHNFRIDLQKDLPDGDNVKSVQFFRKVNCKFEPISDISGINDVMISPSIVLNRIENDCIQILNLPESTKVEVVNLTGQKLRNVMCDDKDYTLDISGLPPSQMYLLKIKSTSGQKVLKFIK